MPKIVSIHIIEEKKQINNFSIEEFKRNLGILIEDLSKSGIKECIYLSKTYKNWYLEIVNSFESKIDTGFLEGYNNKIKVIKRVSYGIKSFEI